MTGKTAFLSELEDALAHGPVERRAKTLRRVTDLFVFGASHFSGDHLALFDGVFHHLVADIDTVARAALADRLKSVANAPAGIVRTLAFDDSIGIAGPVLSTSTRIDNAALVENARTKSQDHLLAISQRLTLVETVTDVLVERGNRDVVLSVARNAGARISETGFLRLVKRSAGDDELAQSVGARPEISRHNFLKLLTTASKAVRLALEAAHPEIAGEIGNAVARAATAIQAKAATASRDYGAARALVKSLRESNRLSEIEVDQFARAGKFEETAVALATLCTLPVEAVERAMVMDREEGILIVAKAIDLSWPTARAVLNLCAGKGGMAADTLERCRMLYSNMKRETALQVVKYQRDNR
ncbi:MAG: DUF2336 domain-containing protein [Pseudolabrys sp.]|nr:DUF2336 domain-containing protein [Pseudolabrys sp.]